MFLNGAGLLCGGTHESAWQLTHLQSANPESAERIALNDLSGWSGYSGPIRSRGALRGLPTGESGPRIRP
jgi:hypothetical protein